ncbi:MAG: signal peptidase II [Thermodesulfobacteriota bacterium]
MLSRRYVVFSAAVVLIVVLDRVTKSAVSEMVAPGAQYQVLPFLDIVHYKNTGIAFGMLRDLGGVSRFILYSGALAAAALFAALFLRSGGKVLPVAFITGGAIGNSIDRFGAGSVTDFIDIHWFGSETLRWPAFNMADMFITVGVAALVISLLGVGGRGDVHGNS